MVKVVFVEFTGRRVELEVAVGTTGMEAARQHNVQGIVAECGGAAACGTCHVYVDIDYLSKVTPASTQEHEILDFTESKRRSNSRLSCQIALTEDLNGIIFTIPEKQVSG